MFPQLTVFARILWIVMVIIVQLCCTASSIHLLSSKTHEFIQVMPNGRIFANGTHMNTQNDIIIKLIKPSHMLVGNVADVSARNISVSLYSSTSNMYICFNKHWKLVGKKKLVDRCRFYEDMDDHGDFTYKSVVSETKKIGFYTNGKPVNYGSARAHDENSYKIFKCSRGSECITSHGSSNTGTNVGRINSSKNHHHHPHHQPHSRRVESKSSEVGSNLQQQQQQQRLQQQQQHRHRHKHQLVGGSRLEGSRGPVLDGIRQKQNRRLRENVTRLKPSSTSTESTVSEHSDRFLLPNLDNKENIPITINDNLLDDSDNNSSSSSSSNSNNEQVFSNHLIRSHNNTSHLSISSSSSTSTSSNKNRRHKIRHHSHRKLIDSR